MYPASDPKTMGACYTRKMGNVKGNGTQEAQDFFLFLVPLVLLVFRSLSLQL